MPARGPVLLCVNHPNNFIDSLLVGGALGRKVHYLATAALFRNWIVGRFLAACGAIHTPALLVRSGFRSPSGQIGHNLSMHPNVKVVAIFDEDVTGWKGAHQAFQVRDDWLGIWGDPAQTGKSRDGDLGRRKITFPVVAAYAVMDRAERRRFRALRTQR